MWVLIPVCVSMHTCMSGYMCVRDSHAYACVDITKEMFYSACVVFDSLDDVLFEGRSFLPLTLLI